MKLSYIFKRTMKIQERGSVLPLLVFIVVAVAGCVNQAVAQRNNMSDWNVPPPVLPGNITKGDAGGKTATSKPIVLTITDIPGITLPATPAEQVMLLAAISSYPPEVNAPEQPVAEGEGNLAAIPLPASPETPPLSGQSSQQDAPVISTDEMPFPDEPDMPESPAEPAPSAQTTGTNSTIPLMPDVLSMQSIAPPPEGEIDMWHTPGIPENIQFILKVPAGKAIGPQNKSTKKPKPKPIKN